MNPLGNLTSKYMRSGPRPDASTPQYVILMVLAMFIFALEPRGPDRGQVVLVVLAGFILLATLTGLVISGTGLKRHFSLKKDTQSSRKAP